MIDDCRAMLEKMCYIMQRQGQLGYARFLQGVQILPVGPGDGRGNFLACVRPESSRFVIELYWPEFCYLPAACQTEIMKHEILHVINGHAGRRGKELIDKYGAMIANIAADLVVNQYIDVKALTGAGIYPVTISTYGLAAGKTAFQYAEELSNLQAKASANLASEHKPIEEFVFAKTELERELADAHQGRVIEDSGKGLASKIPGTESADSVEFFEAINKPPDVDWRVRLRAVEIKQRSANKDTCWRRPSRRMAGMPGRIRVPEDLRIWVALDTSASMSTALGLVDAELKGIVARGADVKVLHFDAEIVKEEKYTRHDSLTAFHGRGGTSFTPVFKKLAEVPPRETPGLLVIFTDGEGFLEFPPELTPTSIGVTKKDRIRPIDVIWLITPGGKEMFIEEVGGCGQVIELKPLYEDK